VLVIALGIAVGAAELFGASMALGAFLAGMVIGQSEFSSRAGSEALPMRDAFAVLFFVSVGMLFDPSQAMANAGLIAGTVAVILVAKPLAAFFAARILHFSAKTAAPVAIALAQIGEFSFILASLGRDLGVLPASSTQALVAAAIISITLNPLFFRLAAPLGRWLTSSSAERSEEPLADVPSAERVIVVGYGPVGRTITKLLIENGLTPTVIELNHETVRGLLRDGMRAIYGDASQREILEQAGMRNTNSLVFAASGTPAESVIRVAKELNPVTRIVSRATYVHEVPAARGAGADVVVAAESEVALAMTEHLLTAIGATSDQLDRARDRVRAELSGARPRDAELSSG
jgi:CPA2 family monovalent cation:H+ antiporter-2